jgi:putative ABC transport system ATP-binding protein
MIQIESLRFHYPRSTFRLEVPHLHVATGQKVALIGPSGVGKTTLVALMTGILVPDGGTLRVAGEDLASRSDRARRDFRISRIGMVFQEFELLDYLTVRDNVLLPFYVNGSLDLTPAIRRAVDELAGSMDLGDKLDRFPRTLSHGERQRIAICRALIASPDLIVADEPTGNLDPATTRAILDLLLAHVEERRATLLVVTHNHALLDAFDRVIDVAEFAGGGQV